MNYRCIFCHTRAFENKINEITVSEELKNSLVDDYYKYMANNGSLKSAPEAARDIYANISRATDNYDPFQKEKSFINNNLLKLYPKLKREIELSENPLDKALRLSIAGNIIDIIASPDYNIQKTINHVLSADFKIDHSDMLFQEIKKARTILYLGDNAGEIVLDKLFIETIKHPNIIYAVRGAPVINDATIADATMVGMQNVAKVISNGSDAPSTLLNSVSDEFLDIYNNADLIISKGQGNLEGLLNENSKNIFFLFMVKCDVIGNKIEAETGDFVVMNNMVLQNTCQAV